MPELPRELNRFLAVGIANTILTYGIYLLILTFSTRIVAFTLAALGGICFTTLANVRIAFERRLTRVSVAVYAAYYFAYWLAWLTMLEVAVRGLGIPEALGPLAVLPVAVPAHFVMSRVVLRRFQSAAGPGSTQ